MGGLGLGLRSWHWVAGPLGGEVSAPTGDAVSRAAAPSVVGSRCPRHAALLATRTPPRPAGRHASPLTASSRGVRAAGARQRGALSRARRLPAPVMPE